MMLSNENDQFNSLNDMTMKTIMVMAAGTGGHIFPGLAIADKLKQLNINVIWLGTQQGMENRIVPSNGYNIEYIEISGLRGKGLKAIIYLPYKLIHSMIQAFKIFKRIKPDLCVGMGGYVTGPAGLMARIMRIPVLVHEQNARAGLTNKLLNIVATKTLCAFPNVISDFYRKSTITVTGNPVRQGIVELFEKQNNDKVSIQHKDSINILVIGGSLGAKQLNEVIPQTIKRMSKSDKNPFSCINVMHQTGKNKQRDNTINLKASQKNTCFDYQFIEFIEDMSSAYEWADLAICRAGALTVSELTLAKLPAVLVPYPYAVDDHQTENARYIESNNAGFIMSDMSLTVDNLLEQLIKLDKGKLIAMRHNMKQIAKPNATEDVLKECLKLIGGDETFNLNDEKIAKEKDSHDCTEKADSSTKEGAEHA